MNSSLTLTRSLTLKALVRVSKNYNAKLYQNWISPKSKSINLVCRAQSIPVERVLFLFSVTMILGSFHFTIKYAFRVTEKSRSET